MTEEEFVQADRWYREYAKSAARAAEARSKMPAGSTRARVTSANARWARAAEARDGRDRELRAKYQAGLSSRPACTLCGSYRGVVLVDGKCKGQEACQWRQGQVSRHQPPATPSSSDYQRAIQQAMDRVTDMHGKDPRTIYRVACGDILMMLAGLLDRATPFTSPAKEKP